MSRLSDLQSKISDLQDQMQEAFRDAAAAFFRGNPNVYIVWAQYAPYFNDGAPCTFDVHEPDLVFVEPDNEDADYQDIGDYSYEYGADNTEGKISKEAREELDELVSFIETEQDLMETLYGDGVCVVLGKDGAKVSEHSHD